MAALGITLFELTHEGMVPGAPVRQIAVLARLGGKLVAFEITHALVLEIEGIGELLGVHGLKPSLSEAEGNGNAEAPEFAAGGTVA